MSSYAERVAQRRNTYKKGVDQEDARRRREETSIQIRKTKREDRLNQRRRTQDPGGAPTMRNGNAFGDALATPAATMQSAADGPMDAALQLKIQKIPEMVMGLNSPDAAVQLEMTTNFRRLLSIERHPPIQNVIDAGVVPKFVQFLRRDDQASLQFEAAWALTNIASGTTDHTGVVIQSGAVPIFVELLMSPNHDVREQAVWALGNIAGDSPPCRDLVISCGAMEPLLKQLSDNTKLSMLRNATWTLSNLCRGKPPPDFNHVRVALPTLAQLIYAYDEEILTDACWATSYLSDGPNERIQSVIEAGMTRRLVQLLMHTSLSVQTPALRTVGNIVTGNDLQTQIVINLGALPSLLSLLGSSKKGIRKEACWTISNITAGSKEQIQEVINANIIPPLIQLLQHAEFDIRKEAAWAISNATSGGAPEQVRYLVSQGCIPPLCELLAVGEAKIVSVAMEGLENILKVGQMDAQEGGTGENQMATYITEADGLEKIEALQAHELDDIYNKAIHMIEAYFGVDYEEDEQLAPAVSADGSQFTFGAGGMGGPGGAPQFNFQG